MSNPTVPITEASHRLVRELAERTGDSCQPGSYTGAVTL